MKIRSFNYDENLFIKDDELNKIEELIYYKEKMLLEKHKQLETVHLENNYLEGIQNDYNNYFAYILKQKEAQITSLKILNDYIEKLISSGELKKYDTLDARMEQQKIKNEIANIKNNLDKIVGKATNTNKMVTSYLK